MTNFPFTPEKIGDFCSNCCQYWTETVVFPMVSGPYHPCSPSIKETRNITIPRTITLPALARIQWSVDDDFIVNGESLNSMIDCGGYGAFGKCCATRGSPITKMINHHQVQIELLDTIGIYWGGSVTITIGDAPCS
jgi:hypothetical protein